MFQYTFAQCHVPCVCCQATSHAWRLGGSVLPAPLFTLTAGLDAAVPGTCCWFLAEVASACGATVASKEQMRGHKGPPPSTALPCRRVCPRRCVRQDWTPEWSAAVSAARQMAAQAACSSAGELPSIAAAASRAAAVLPRRSWTRTRYRCASERTSVFLTCATAWQELGFERVVGLKATSSHRCSSACRAERIRFVEMSCAEVLEHVDSVCRDGSAMYAFYKHSQLM